MGDKTRAVIKEWRTRAELTQAELADKCGLSLATIKSYEGKGINSRTPTRSALRKIAEACGIPALELEKVWQDETQPEETPEELAKRLRMSLDKIPVAIPDSDRAKELLEKINYENAQIAKFKELGFMPGPEKLAELEELKKDYEAEQQKALQAGAKIQKASLIIDKLFEMSEEQLTEMLEVIENAITADLALNETKDKNKGAE